MAEEGQNQTILNQHIVSLKQQLGGMSYQQAAGLSRLHNHDLEVNASNMKTISEEDVDGTGSKSLQTTAEKLAERYAALRSSFTRNSPSR